MSQLKHVISIEQFLDKQLLQKLFDTASRFSELPPAEYPTPLQHLTLASIFFEPSTRTRLSFEAAIQNLGGRLLTVESAGEFSSAKKGESLEDTILVLNMYADGIVMRHTEIGAAARASRVSSVPLINAGDGAGEHPTQALLDLYSIQKAHGKVDGLKIALVGDLLFGRTVHSLVPLLALYNIELFLIAPPSLKMPAKQIAYLKRHNVSVTLSDSWDGVIDKVDVLYMTRVQKERFKLIEDYIAVKDSFILTHEQVKKMKKNAIILHPLPRVNEIEPRVDEDPRAYYFEQVRNGLFVRMALLDLLFDN